MTEQEAIEIHIAENIRRIEVIEDFMHTNYNPDDAVCGKNISVLSKINGLLQMVQQYRAIGTVEECWAAVEKQKAKKPDFEGDGYADGNLVYDTWICPCCGKHYEVDYDDYDFCPNCGQKLDWGEGE